MHGRWMCVRARRGCRNCEAAWVCMCIPVCAYARFLFIHGGMYMQAYMYFAQSAARAGDWFAARLFRVTFTQLPRARLRGGLRRAAGAAGEWVKPKPNIRARIRVQHCFSSKCLDYSAALDELPRGPRCSERTIVRTRGMVMIICRASAGGTRRWCIYGSSLSRWRSCRLVIIFQTLWISRGEL